MKVFIAIEGGDGSGKSTLKEVLAAKLGATPYNTPPKKYLEQRGRIDKDASIQEHYDFYLRGIHDAAREIKKMLSMGEGVVSDRYWLSTYTYHEVMGVNVRPEDFEGVVKPDLTVILSLSHDVQIERMSVRGLSEGDLRMIEKQREIADAFYKNAVKFGVPFLVIDTQRFSPEDAARIVVAAVD